MAAQGMQPTGDNVSGGATSTGAQTGGDDLNFGSARSDYGDLAYGGLDRQGTGGSSVDTFSQGRRDVGSKGYGSVGPRAEATTGGGNTALALLAGIGLGAALMYLLDPERGRTRRALLRDKVVSLSNQTGDALGKTARDLRNRAQGVIAEAGSAINSQLGGSTSQGQQPAAAESNDNDTTLPGV